eukprot:3645535-Prymnesium_polylepis.1
MPPIPAKDRAPGVPSRRMQRGVLTPEATPLPPSSLLAPACHDTSRSEGSHGSHQRVAPPPCTMPRTPARDRAAGVPLRGVQGGRPQRRARHDGALPPAVQRACASHAQRQPLAQRLHVGRALHLPASLWLIFHFT